MRRSVFLPILAFCTVISGNCTGWSQESSRSERFFSYLDRDRDGAISPEEYKRLDERMQERLLQMGVAPNRNISKTEFLEAMAGAEEIRRREQEAEGGSRSERSAPASPGAAAGGKTKAKTRLVLDLPAAYQALDKNSDRQIGLYEWDRTKLADFAKLDRNGDGFLTAKELQNPAGGAPAPPASPPATAKPAPAAAPAAPSQVVTKPAAASGSGKPREPASRPKVVETPAKVESPDERLTKQAAFYFKSTDKDSNGEISAEEWAQSRGIRPMFEAAKVSPTLPLDEARFTQEFLKIKQNSK